MGHPTTGTAAVETPTSCILAEANKLITKDRRADYGPARESFDRVAALWTAILGTTIKAPQVAQCMIAFKLAREAYRPKRDNRTDIIGYTALLDALEQPTTPATAAIAPTVAPAAATSSEVVP